MMRKASANLEDCGVAASKIHEGELEALFINISRVQCENHRATVLRVMDTHLAPLRIESLELGLGRVLFLAHAHAAIRVRETVGVHGWQSARSHNVNGDLRTREELDCNKMANAPIFRLPYRIC